MKVVIYSVGIINDCLAIDGNLKSNYYYFHLLKFWKTFEEYDDNEDINKDEEAGAKPPLPVPDVRQPDSEINEKYDILALSS